MEHARKGHQRYSSSCWICVIMSWKHQHTQKGAFVAVRKGWVNYLKFMQVLANQFCTSYTGVRTLRNELPTVKGQEPLDLLWSLYDVLISFGLHPGKSDWQIILNITIIWLCTLTTLKQSILWSSLFLKSSHPALLCTMYVEHRTFFVQKVMKHNKNARHQFVK